MTMSTKSTRKLAPSTGILLYDKTGWEHEFSIDQKQVDIPIELAIGTNQICLESKDHTVSVSIFDLYLLP